MHIRLSTLRAYICVRCECRHLSTLSAYAIEHAGSAYIFEHIFEHAESAYMLDHQMDVTKLRVHKIQHAVSANISERTVLSMIEPTLMCWS